MLALAAVAAFSSGTICFAQDSGAAGDLNAMPNGGLRGPQDIIDSTNALDSYGNPRTSSPVGQSFSPAPSADPAPGTIRPFSGGPAGYPPASSFQSPPSSYAGTPNNGYNGGAPSYQGSPGGYQQGGYPPGGYQNGYQAGAGGYQSPNGYQANGASQPLPSYKHHNHHHKNKSYNDPTAIGSVPPQGLPPQGLTNAPPTASLPPTKHHSGNDSVAGAAVGVPDRAGKAAIGVSGKAAKEVLKAVF